MLFITEADPIKIVEFRDGGDKKREKEFMISEEVKTKMTKT